MYIFPRGLTHFFGPKMAIFPTFFFRQYKNKKIEKSKNWHFSKLVNPRFWSEKCDFSFFFFFLGNIGQKNVFYYILKRKNAFLGYKNKKLQKSKNWHFSKKVNPGFVSKMAIFAIFFFRQYRPRKCLSWYFRTKKLLSRL